MTSGSEIKLSIMGDIPNGDIILDLPIMENGVLEAAAGEVLPSGALKLSADTREVTIRI